MCPTGLLTREFSYRCASDLWAIEFNSLAATPSAANKLVCAFENKWYFADLLEIQRTLWLTFHDSAYNIMFLMTLRCMWTPVSEQKAYIVEGQGENWVAFKDCKF